MLTIQTGGTLADSFGTVGDLPGGLGTVTVTGAGSNWSNAGGVVVGGLGTGTLTIENGGTLNSGGGSIGLAVGSTGTVVVTGSGSSWINGPSNGLNIGSFGTGTLMIADGGKVINSTAFPANIGEGLGSHGTVTVTGAGSTWSNSVGVNIGYFGTGTLTIADGGVVTGPVVIAARVGSIGTLNIGAGAGQAPAPPGTLTAPGVAFRAGAGTLDFNHTSTDYVFAPLISGNGTVNVLAGTTILTADNTYTGSTTISLGTLQLGDGGTTGSIVTNVTDNGTLAFDRSDTVTFPGLISGTGSVAQIGTGTTILTANNAYTGGTTISLGTLQLGNGGTTGSIVGNVTDNGTLAFDRGDTVTFPGVISGSGAVAQIGTGTIILTSDNSYSGGTTIAAGTLQVGNGGATGSVGTGPVLDDGALVFNRSGVVAVPGAVTGTGSLTQTGVAGGTLVLTGSNTYSGGTTIASGTLQLGSGGTTGSIVGDVADSGTLAFDRSDTVTFPGVISGTGSVTQIGTGATILTANNPYTGGTTVNAGTLVVGDPGHAAAALSGGGPVYVAPGATLAGFGSVTGSVTNDGTVAAGNATPGFGTAAAGQFTINGDLLNANLVALTPDQAVGNVLLVRGNYAAGASGGTLLVSTLLNAGGPLSNQFTDRLLVQGNASGTTSVHIVNAGGSGAITSFTGIPDPGDGISIVQVAGTSTPGAFTLAGGYVTGGTPFQYNLYAYGPGSPNGNAEPTQSLVGTGDHWDYRLQNVYVTPGGPLPPEPEPPAPTPPTPLPPADPLPEPGPPAPPLPPDARPEVAPQVPAYLTAPTALFDAGFQDIDSLHRRLGEIHDDQILGLAPQGEVFLRAYGTTFNYTSDRSFTAYGFNSSGDYAATQFGGNWIAVNNEAGTVRLGLAATLGRLWYQPIAIDGQSKGLFNTESLAGTATWQSQRGWYVDAIVMGGMFDGTVTTPNRGQTVGFNGTSLAASLEAGYPIPLGWQRLLLEPEAQFIYQHLNFPQRTDVDGINVALGSPDQGVFRGGVRLIGLYALPNGSLLRPYLEANLLQGIGGGNDVQLSNVAFGTGPFGTALQVGGGITGTLTRNLSVYGDVAWQDNVGNDGGFRGWAFNGGLRFAFGAAPAAVAGIPAAAPAPAAVRTYLVFFDWDRADLTDRARQIIAEAAAASTRVQLTRIEVNGYTDTSGSPHYNQALSLRRAEAVAADLVRDGVERSVIAIHGFGETHLLVPTGLGVREPQNRRVEIVLQ